MNFVAQVEDHLRDLGAEARKTHPGTISFFSRFCIVVFVLDYYCL